MANEQVRITWINEQSFLESVKRARAAVGDLTPAMTLIAKDFFSSEKSVFERQGPGPYEDLTRRYKKRKQKRWGFVYPINKASGALMRSVTNPGDENAIFQVSSAAFLVGSRVAYSSFVQRRRPFLFSPGSGYDTNQTKNRIQRWNLILKSFVAQKLAKQTSGK